MSQDNDDKFDGEGGNDAALTGEINAMLLEVEQLETGASGDKQKAAAQPATPPASASPEPSASPTPPQGASQEGDEKPDGDLPQGKVKMVPHGALHEERERRRQAELHAQKLEDELRALRGNQHGGETGEAAETDETADDMAFMSEEDLQALEAESPVIAKSIRAQQQMIAGLRQQLSQAAVVIDKVAQEQTNKVRSQVQAAIDATPEVAYAASLRAQGDTETWDRMTEIDKELKASAYWRGVPTAERLAKVAREYADRYGEIELPPEFAAKRAKPSTSEPTVDEVAAAKVQAAKAKAAAAPKTLSDLPAGILPDGDRNQGLKALSVRAMQNRMQEMDVDKINDLISTL